MSTRSLEPFDRRVLVIHVPDYYRNSVRAQGWVHVDLLTFRVVSIVQCQCLHQSYLNRAISLDANEHAINSVTASKSNKAEVIWVFKVSLEMSL